MYIIVAEKNRGKDFSICLRIKNEPSVILSATKMAIVKGINRNKL
jgi:hypothetical protein